MTRKHNLRRKHILRRNPYGPKTSVYGDLKWELTCPACPEQYDVFYKGKQVAYIRERWDCITVSCPDVSGETVWDEWNSHPRQYAGQINDAILNWIQNNNFE